MYQTLKYLGIKQIPHFSEGSQILLLNNDGTAVLQFTCCTPSPLVASDWDGRVRPVMGPSTAFPAGDKPQGPGDISQAPFSTSCCWWKEQDSITAHPAEPPAGSRGAGKLLGGHPSQPLHLQRQHSTATLLGTPVVSHCTDTTAPADTAWGWSHKTNVLWKTFFKRTRFL